MTSKNTHNRDTAKSIDEMSGDGPLYLTEPEEISTPDNDHSSKPEFVPGGFGSYQQKSDFAGTLDDIPVTLEVKLVRPLGEKISYDVFWKLILNQKIPVTTSLITVMGLPSSGKTAVLEYFLRQKVKVKAGARIDHYFERKKNEQCLSIYELCALGSSQHNMYAWSFATKRYGAIFSILCGLIRQYPIVSRIVFKLRNRMPDSVIEQHVQWLMVNIQYLLEKIKDESDKLTLIQDGISLINIMDVGVNKALYDFLSMMLLSCGRHICLAFFSLNRDGPNLGEKPDLPSQRYGERRDDVLVMQQKSRLTYLLHFATVGRTTKDQHEQETKNATVMIATRKSSATGSTPSLDQAKKEIIEQARSRGVDQFLKNWIVIDVDDDQSITKEFGQRMEDILKNKYEQLTIQLPLRWIFLRSLVVSLDSTETKAIILSKEYIIKIADKLDMKEDEVEDFLKTFTDFGSILYMPQYNSIKDIVIVNIWEFTQYLNKLYYPQEGDPYAANLLKYGIISESTIKGIFYKYPDTLAENFMKVLTTIGMASKINSGLSILVDKNPLLREVHYYLPLARIHEVYIPPEEENDYAFIEIESVNFPTDVQAGISYAIMDNNDNAVLIATEHSNVSRFLFQSESGPPITIEIIYKESKTRLRIMNSSNDILTSPAAVEACCKVITASCRCLQRKINTIRDLKYSFAVPCASLKGGCHFLYNDCEPQLCDACSTENNFRLCWSKAAKKCELLSKNSATKLGKDSSAARFSDDSLIASFSENDFSKDVLVSKLIKERLQLLDHITSLKEQLNKETSELTDNELYIAKLLKEKEQLQERVTSLEEQSIKETSSIKVADNELYIAKLLKEKEQLQERVTSLEEQSIKETSSIKVADNELYIAKLLKEKEQLQERVTSLEEQSIKETSSVKVADNELYTSKLLKEKEQLQERVTSLEEQFINETSSKEVQFDYMIPSMDNLECLSDVQVAEKKLFLIQGDKPQLMNWEKFGLRIGVQEGSLLSFETVEAAVVALVGGQFQFPPNTVLVSAVYAVSLSKPLLKQLKLEIQHCVDLIGRPDLAQYLKFAIAPVNTPSLPYLFKLVEGGEFSSNSGYGSIQRKEFCLVCILGEEWTNGGGNGVPVASVNGDIEEGEEEQEEEQPQQEENEEEEEEEEEGEQQLQHEEEEIEQQQIQKVEEQGNNEHEDVQQEQEGEEQQQEENEEKEEEEEQQLHVQHEEEEFEQQEEEFNEFQEQQEEEEEEEHKDEDENKGDDCSSDSSSESSNTIGTLEASGAAIGYHKLQDVQICEKRHTEIKEEMNYTILVYYHGDLVIFTSAKNLNALIQYIKKEYSQATKGAKAPFKFQQSCIELKFDVDLINGSEIMPHTKPCILHRCDVDNFCDVNLIPPYCLVTLYASPDASPTLRYPVQVEGTVDPVTLYIIKTTSQLTKGISSDSSIKSSSTLGASGSTSFNVETAKQKIKQVMNQNHADFAELLQFSLGQVANKLFQAEIIPQEIQESPTYNAIAKYFLSMMNILDSKSALEKHCMMFLEALSSAGGPVEHVAKRLRKKWTTALEGALQFGHESS